MLRLDQDLHSAAESKDAASLDSTLDLGLPGCLNIPAFDTQATGLVFAFSIPIVENPKM